ncbi:hypothetical protein ACWD0A_15475 [Streptomyces sp. NPDC002867]
MSVLVTGSRTGTVHLPVPALPAAALIAAAAAAITCLLCSRRC